MRELLLAVLAAVSVVSAADASTITYSLVPGPGGPGTFALTASTSAGDNFGLDFYSVTISGAATIQHVNVSPRGFDTDTGLGYGFSILRSADNDPVVEAAQDFTGVPVYGLGQTAGTLKSLLPAGDAFAGGRPDANGTYGAPLVLATGTYVGAQPTIVPAVTTGWVFTSQNAGRPFNYVGSATSIVIDNSFTARVVIDNVNANDPGMVTRDLSSFYTGPPPNQFGFNGYTSPAGVSSYPTLAHPATLDPITKEFRWNTTGAALGKYSWHSAYLDNNGNWTPHVDLTVRITAVPEPATLSLLGLATIAGFGFANHRRRTTSESAIWEARMRVTNLLQYSFVASYNSVGRYRYCWARQIQVC